MTDTENQTTARTGDASDVKQGDDPFHVRVFRAHSQLAGVRSLLMTLERSVWSVHQDISAEAGSLSGEQHLIEIIDKKIADVMDLLLRPGETAPEAEHLDALLARFRAAVQQIIDGLQREQR